MKRTLALCAMTLMLAPLALAHDPAGTPKTYCEPPWDWRIHDYNMDPPETGVYAGAATVDPVVQGHWPGSDHNPRKFMWPYLDGNLEECGTTYGAFVLTDEECWFLAHSGVSGPAYDAACQTDTPVDYDGHHEFGYIGRALLSVRSGDGVTSGSIACYDEVGHHPFAGSIYVYDIVFPNVAFDVVADYTDPASPVPPGEKDCGDGIVQPCDPTPPEPSGAKPPVNVVIDLVNALLYSLSTSTCNPSDRSISCLDHCTPSFGPGIDGAYHVRVGATAAGGPNGEPTGADQGHVVS